MRTKKLDKAWTIFKEISDREMSKGSVNVGYVIGGTLPMKDEIEMLQSEVQSLTSQPLNDHPDPNLSPEDYGRALHKILTSGLAEKLDMERVLLPTGEFAARLKKLNASYFEYIGLAMVMDDWYETLFENLERMGFRAEEYTDEELNALFERSVGLQGDLYLMLLEGRQSA